MTAPGGAGMPPGVVDAGLLDVSGPAAPPRRNGELVFAEPWESRAFGMAMALHAGGAFEWETFRQELMAAIARWEGAHDPDDDWSYYRCWLDALERVLASERLVSEGDVDGRVGELSCRPAGHDHSGHSHHPH